MSKRGWKPVSNSYLGQPLPDAQEPPKRGGGSAPTPQTTRMRAGSGRIGSSAPAGKQRVRG